jgi:glycosyltransferase involved in cell wall biosynthesis
MVTAGLKVSVAMCTYNAEAYLEPQLLSIFEQTRPPDELVICDDGSKDKTVEMIERMARGRPTTVRLIRNPKNLGCVRNFEKSVSLTTGDVIFLSDFDDFWLAEKIEAMVEPFVENPDIVVVYCDAGLADGELRPSGESVFGRRSSVRLTDPPSLLQFGRGFLFNGVMMAFRSTLKPFVIPFSTDWEHDHWISSIGFSLGEIKPIGKQLLYYRRHGRNRGLDPDLDGGAWNRYLQAAKRSRPKQYAQRRRRWEDLVRRLGEMENSDPNLKGSSRFNDAFKEAQRCLEFARKRENLKGKYRALRVPGALKSLLAGEYQRHSHGVKSFVQDLMIP